MRPTDKLIFALAAKDLKVWILVRRTNAESLRHIGEPDCIPKPMECKAKTADNNPRFGGSKYDIAGLVVNPHLHISAFKGNKGLSAIHSWEMTAPLVSTSPSAQKYGYYVIMDTQNPRYGCLTINGKFVYGDYDLYDVVDIRYLRPNLALVQSVGTSSGTEMDHRRGFRVKDVMAYVNKGIGVDVVQHGGEAQYAGRFSDQVLDYFGPGGEQGELNGIQAIKEMYKTKFGGRRIIGG